MPVLPWLAEPWHSPLLARGGLTALLVGVPAAGIGCWVILKDLPYAAESLAHGMFPGLVAAALLGLPLLLGGLVGLLVAGGAIAVTRRLDVESEAAVATAITPLIGLGAILSLSGSTPPGAESFLFGDVLATSTADTLIAFAFALAAIVALRIGHWRFVASGTRASGRNAVELAVLVMLTAATIAAARSLGTLMTVALILGPAAAARTSTRRAGPMVALAMGIAAAAVVAGVELSWHSELPTGPSIAICAIIPAALAATVRRVGRTATSRPLTPTAID